MSPSPSRLCLRSCGEHATRHRSSLAATSAHACFFVDLHLTTTLLPPPSSANAGVPYLVPEIAGYTTIIFPLIFCGAVMWRHIFDVRIPYSPCAYDMRRDTARVSSFRGFSTSEHHSHGLSSPGAVLKTRNIARIPRGTFVPSHKAAVRSTYIL